MRGMTISETCEQFLSEKFKKGTEHFKQNSYRTYRSGLEHFRTVLVENGIDPTTSLPDEIPNDIMRLTLKGISFLEAGTEKVYTQALQGYLEYLAAEELCDINFAKISRDRKIYGRKLPKRLILFPEEDIEALIDYASQLNEKSSETDRERLRNLRDRALILTLADTGLRISEACSLLVGDLDLKSRRAVVIGKGDKEAIVRFSKRSISAIKDYLTTRTQLLSSVGKHQNDKYLFSRHDKGIGAGNIAGITPRTGQNIVIQRITESIGDDAAGAISPHTLRHYFVTRSVRAAGIFKAKELARHENIHVTTRYTHLAERELDKDYEDIFE